jgi:hypothetical protein
MIWIGYPMLLHVIVSVGSFSSSFPLFLSSYFLPSKCIFVCAASELNQMAWLLKTVAVELKVTATHMHHSQLGNLVNLLVREQGEEMVAVSVEEDMPSEVTEMATIMQLSHYLTTPSGEFIDKSLSFICNIFKYMHQNLAEIFMLNPS